MTAPTTWAELQHQLSTNGNTPVPVTPQNRQAAADLRARGLAVITHRTSGPSPRATTVRLKDKP